MYFRFRHVGEIQQRYYHELSLSVIYESKPVRLSTPVPFGTNIGTRSTNDIKLKILSDFEIFCKVQVITFKVKLTRTFFVKIPWHISFHAIQTCRLCKKYIKRLKLGLRTFTYSSRFRQYCFGIRK